MMQIDDRMLVKVARGEWVVVEPAEVYWLEAAGSTTWVRLRGKRRYQDVRPLGELVEQLAGVGGELRAFH